MSNIRVIDGVTKFFDDEGKEIEGMTLAEIDGRLYAYHSEKVNEEYRKTLGYRIRKLLGLRIPQFNNNFGWY